MELRLVWIAQGLVLLIAHQFRLHEFCCLGEPGWGIQDPDLRAEPMAMSLPICVSLQRSVLAVAGPNVCGCPLEQCPLGLD